MYEVFVVERYDGGEFFRHHSYLWSAVAAEKRRQQLESEGKDAFWLKCDLSTRVLLGWTLEVLRSIPWWVWLLI
jgi:hypothetical protein